MILINGNSDLRESLTGCGENARICWLGHRKKAASKLWPATDFGAFSWACPPRDVGASAGDYRPFGQSVAGFSRGT